MGLFPRFNRMMTSLMALVLASQCVILPVFATETDNETAPQETSVPVETSDISLESIPETIPQEEIPSVPQETQPAQYGLPFLPADVQETSPETNSEATVIPSPDEGEEALMAFLQENSHYHQNGMPKYFQNDYPDVRYGAGTIATSGCGVVSLAMVASYLTGYDYQPDVLAGYFGGVAENNIKRLEKGSDALQLPWKRSKNFDYTMAALQEGKVVIALMEHDSAFTDGQHFIVLSGMTSDGRILVNDPNEANYDMWNLKEGFRSGFTRDEILKGYSGGWIYDPEGMPKDPFIYIEEPLDKSKTRYPGVELTLAEENLLARVVWVEARGESPEGQQAIAEIVLNRLVSGSFGDSIAQVIYGEGQFRSVPFLDKAEPYQAQYDAILNALYGENILPIDVYYFATERTNANVWGQIGGHIFCYDAEED